MATQNETEVHVPLAEGGRIDVRQFEGGVFLEITTSHGASRATTRAWLTPDERKLVCEALGTP